MKRLFYTALTIFILCQSCSTDFDLTSDWKDITVVYGMLDKNADTTFIKVSKAFLDPTTSALTIAQNGDSLFYRNMDARLEGYEGSDLKQNILLTRVDGNLIGHHKDSLDQTGQNKGVFAQQPNYLYITTDSIYPNRTYKLVLANGDNGRIITSTTEVVDDFSVSQPYSVLKALFLSGRNHLISWTSAQDGKVYGLTIRVHFREIDKISGKDTAKYIDWPIFKNKLSGTTASGSNMSFSIPGDNIYTALKTYIPENPNVNRVIGRLDYNFSVAGQSYYDYTQVAEAQTGLTSGQVQPEFSNIENGKGLFTSRLFKSVNGIELDSRTIDSLACGHVTKALNFLDHKGERCQ